MVLSGGRSWLRLRATDMAHEVTEKGVVEIDEIAEAGHYIAEENPQGFADAVLTFVEKHR